MDVGRLTELYGRFAPLLHARARRVLGGSGSEAEDIVQEVFIKLIAASPNDEQLVAWLYTCCTNLCLDRLRFLARRHDGWKTELERTIGNRSSSVDELLAHKDLCRKLLATVDERTQAIVALVHLDEMTQQEAADQLGLSRKTVVKRLGQFAEHTEKVVKRWQSEPTPNI